MSTKRKRLSGFVKSNKMMKTVVVEVGRTYRHPVYKKVVHATKRYKAHDELGCEVGDKVTIVESKPLSREKRWMVQSIDKRLGQAETELIDISEETQDVISSGSQENIPEVVVEEEPEGGES
jgi:small subunit ribosomal protein S17